MDIALFPCLTCKSKLRWQRLQISTICHKRHLIYKNFTNNGINVHFINGLNDMKVYRTQKRLLKKKDGFAFQLYDVTCRRGNIECKVCKGSYHSVKTIFKNMIPVNQTHYKSTYCLINNGFISHTITYNTAASKILMWNKIKWLALISLKTKKGLFQKSNNFWYR